MEFLQVGTRYQVADKGVFTVTEIVVKKCSFTKKLSIHVKVQTPNGEDLVPGEWLMAFTQLH